MRLILVSLLLIVVSIIANNHTDGRAALVRFDDTLSRSIMMPLSAAAYSDDPQKCLTNQLKTAKVCIT